MSDIYDMYGMCDMYGMFVTTSNGVTVQLGGAILGERQEAGGPSTPYWRKGIFPNCLRVGQ